jgi:hypothetical protein
VIRQSVARRSTLNAQRSTLNELHTMTASPSVRAPDFPATLDWMHTSGRALTLAELRGRIVILDFWTYG